MPQTGFQSLGIDQRLLEALKTRNIITPTDIQHRAIPHVLAGDDLVARSDTGTGKTLAYLLPLLQKVNPESKSVQAVIIAPTQELAMQIYDEAKYYGEALGVQALPLIGGASVRRQVERLKKRPHVVVGTPGRLLELIRMRKLKMHEVRTVVIDEADHVLAQGDMGLADEIVRRTLRDRQLLLFSATVPDEVVQFAAERSGRLVRIGQEEKESTAETIEHHYVVTNPRNKIDTMRRLYHAYRPRAGIVFVSDGDQIELIGQKLRHVGLPVRTLHSQADKRNRALVMQQFRDGQFPLLVATDMAARGLDLDEVTHVFHFDPAFDAKAYIHRSGRTGRMGKKGISVSLVTPGELSRLKKIARELNIKIHPKKAYQGRIVDARI